MYIHWVVYIRAMARSGIPTRERIISAANTLFYNDGIRGVSVDAVAAKAGVTKRTLYYHFKSKDDLVAAYLAARDQPNLALFRQWFAEADDGLPAQVERIFRNLARSARHPKWKGCGFLRTSAELANMPGHPAMKIGAAHKKKFEEWLRATFAAAGIAQAAQLARQILLLLDGSFAVVLLHRDPSYMETAGRGGACVDRGGASRAGEATGAMISFPSLRAALKPAARSQHLEHRAEIRHDGGASRARLVRRRHHVRHHDRDRAGGVGGGHAVIGILDRDANFRLQAKPRRRQKIEIGARLAARDVVAGQDRLKTVANAGKLQMRVRRAQRRGGDDRHRTFRRLQRIQQFDRAAFQRQAGAENFIAVARRRPG